MFKEIKQIKSWLETMGITNYVIDENLFVHVDGDVGINEKELTEIPVKFGVVTGNFLCHKNKLTSLNGSPYKCQSFNCSENLLHSLEGGPVEVAVDFFCHNNRLESLKFGPVKPVREYYCFENKLKNLSGAPKEVMDTFICSKNELVSLRGAPQKVGRVFDCSFNQLVSLKGGPIEVGDTYDCSHNKLESLEGIVQKVYVLSAQNNQIKSLKHCPIILDDLCISFNKLESLEYAPKSVPGHFLFRCNELTNLNYAPEYVGHTFDCGGNKLTNFKGIENLVACEFRSEQNQIESFEFLPKEVTGSLLIRQEKIIEGFEAFIIDKQLLIDTSLKELNSFILKKDLDKNLKINLTNQPKAKL